MKSKEIKIAVAGVAFGAVAVIVGMNAGGLMRQSARDMSATPAPTTTQMPSTKSIPTTTKQPAQVPLQSNLSTSMYAHLSSYAKRVQHATHLPLPANGENVVYISPASGYAITQLHHVWPNIKNPTVIWLDTTPIQAQTDWTKLGYKSDPLPSKNTQYLNSMIPEPDAYHHTKTGWIELPGILRPNQTKDWITFFNTSKL